jgi:molybdopterin-guanine dinucleotide biosynthesis protein A
MGRDKALIEVRGRVLVDVLAERMQGVADPVLLAPGRPGRLGPRPYPEVADAAPDAGPLGGVIAALEASPCPLMAVVAVDMPHANPEVLTVLAKLHDGEDAVVPVTDAGLEPLHAVYATSALAPLRAALGTGRYGMRDVLASLTVREVGKKEWGSIDPSGGFATNINRPEDLDLLAF